MSAETVTNKIEEKAKEQALEILATADKEALKVREDILSDARAREEKIIGVATQNADTVKKGIIQSAMLNSKLLILGAKRDAMNKVKEEAKKKILAFNDNELIAFFVKAIKSSNLTGEHFLVPSKNYRKFADENIEKIEKESGIDLTLAFFDADIETGFVLSNEFYDVDFSIEAIIEDAFERNEKAIYDTLFEGEE